METQSATGGTLNIDRLFYTFPVGEDLTVTAGPIVRTDDAGMYAGYATYYPADLMLDFFTYGGAWSTNTLTGAGAGLGAVYSINDSGFSVSGNYVARNGADSDAGIGTDESQFTSSWQLFYEGELFDGNFLAQAGYSVNRGVGFTMATTTDITNSSNYSLAAAWKPADSGLMPSISTGYSKTDDADSTSEFDAWYVGFEWSDVFVAGNSLGTAIGVSPNTPTDGDTSTLWELFYAMPVTDNITITPAIFTISDNVGTDDADSTSEFDAWYVGLEWSDVFLAGNSLGTAIGVTPNTPTDGDTSTLWELFYSMPVTDNITITPAIFTISDNVGTDDAFGGIVKTTFKF
jgi:hypothetical protein